jgi:hypothetical protein
MRTTLKLPGLSQAVSQVIGHFLAVFLLAFGTQLVAGATHAVSLPTLLALLTAAAAAGLVAVAHVVLGLIPDPHLVAGVHLKDGRSGRYTSLGVSLKIETAGYQFVTSVLITFFGILGASLVGGAAGITSLPSAVAVVLAAIAAAVAGVVQFVIGLIPAPKAAA